MKLLILQADGMPDYPIKELGGKTPLEVADTPNIKKLAKNCIMGMTRTIPDGFPPGSDVGNLSVLGYNPQIYYTGRAPLEAVSMGLKLNSDDIAYRCNLVTLDGNGLSAVMKDYSAGHITSEEARDLILFINKNLKFICNKDRHDGIEFYPGVSYRHIMLWRGGSADYKCTPPHDITGKEIKEFLPTGANDFLKNMVLRSFEILNEHPVNQKRKKNGKNTANAIWLWGQGKAVTLPSIEKKYGLKGAVIAGVDLIKGIGMSAGLNVISVKGATGYLDTNYEGKGEAAAEALKKNDLVFVHLEAPDEAGHNGNYIDKIKAIEAFDKRLLKTALAGLTSIKEYTVLLLSDHPTPCTVRTHVAEPIPFLIHSSTKKMQSSAPGFTENYAKKTGLFIDNGWELLDNVISGKFFS
jgi:2,3-bisphosphoglycerate-independent phosphoglycerate mutase